MPTTVPPLATLCTAVTLLAAIACTHPSTMATPSGSAAETGTPYVQAPTEIAAGEYLTIVGGCGDCHTAMTPGKEPGADALLAGNPVGYRGPWGTSYAANLRMAVQHLSEDRWVSILKTHNGRPPMPWGNLHKMNERDLRAIYAYIKSLGSAGTRTPRSLPPGQTPTTPTVDLTPQPPGGHA